MLSLITPINPSDKNVGAVTVAVNKNNEYPTNESKNGVRRLIFNEHTRFDSFVDVPSGYYRKATVEEIVEYFKNNEK